MLAAGHDSLGTKRDVYKRQSIRSELRVSEINMNSRLESMNKTIAGMKGEIIININKIQDEVNENRTLMEEVENLSLIHI